MIRLALAICVAAGVASHAVAQAPTINYEITVDKRSETRTRCRCTCAASATCFRSPSRTDAWARAGLHSGDKLLAMNGTPMRQLTDARNFLTRQKIGDTVVVDIVRAGKPQRVTVNVTGFQQPVVRISEGPDATAKQRAIRDRWMRAEP